MAVKTNTRVADLLGKLATYEDAHSKDLRARLGEHFGEDLGNPELLSAVVEGERWLEHKSAFNPSAHPRASAGSTAGGQFIVASTSPDDNPKVLKGGAAKGAAKLLGGKLTPDSIKKYQATHGLKVDGEIGRQTAAALLGQSNAKDLPPGTMTNQQLEALIARAGAKKPSKRHTSKKK